MAEATTGMAVERGARALLLADRTYLSIIDPVIWTGARCWRDFPEQRDD